jgi:hypothetical protein
MKRPAKAVLIALWVVIASVLLTRLWIAHPEIFPEFPKPLSEYLASMYGAQNAEDIADLEVLVGLLMSVPTVSVITYSLLIAWRKYRHATHRQ